jgi:hypothetical protein
MNAMWAQERPGASELAFAAITAVLDDRVDLYNMPVVKTAYRCGI